MNSEKENSPYNKDDIPQCHQLLMRYDTGDKTVSEVQTTKYSTEGYENVSDILSLAETFLVGCGFVLGNRSLKLLSWEDESLLDYMKEKEDCDMIESIEELKTEDCDYDCECESTGGACVEESHINPVQAMMEGHKVKRKDWKGYWYSEFDDDKYTVYIYYFDEYLQEFCTINLLQTPNIMYTLSNLTYNDWEIVEENKEKEEE